MHSCLVSTKILTTSASDGGKALEPEVAFAWAGDCRQRGAVATTRHAWAQQQAA